MMVVHDAKDGILSRLIQELTRLPGIGPKSAERIAYFLVSGDRQVSRDLAELLQAISERVKPCTICYNLSETPICAICGDPRRDHGLICVVETPRDVALFERMGSYRGDYHVLGGRLAPLDNMGPDQLTVEPLARRVRQGGIREVILATSPTLEGDGTALFVSSLLAGTGVKMTRLARGLPTGASLELINAHMLSEALEGRKSF